MNTDLDQLLKLKDMEGIIVFGNGDHNPSMVYLTGGGHFTNAMLIKKYGSAPVLVANSMEREEAARSGLLVDTFDFEILIKFMKEHPDNKAKGSALLLKHYLEKYQLTTGKVGLYGQVDLTHDWAVLNELKAIMPGLILTGEMDKSVLDASAILKRPDEIDRIRRMGEVTVNVVGKVQQYLSSNCLRDGVLVNEKGNAITVGDVKSRIDLWLAEAGAENPEGTIFSIGRDAGIGHSSGTTSDQLRAGQTIVFDIFPCEKGGGYFYDFTRTWCLGYATPEIQKHYDQVKSVYDTILGELKTGVLCQVYQQRTCELFESMGHVTIAKDPNTTNGYNHSLGHGLGLRVHEGPWFSQFMPAEDNLTPGMVFTIEPGLYYPENGFGVRLEDTFYVTADGAIQRFVEYPMDLVIPVKGK